MEHVDELEDIEIEDEVTEEPENPAKNAVLLPSEHKHANIKNKIIRNAQFQKLKREKKKAKREERKRRQREDGPKQVPHTLESLRIKDENYVGDITAPENAQVRAEIENDEFQDYFEKSYEPKVLITYSDNPLKKTRIFGRELMRIIPNSLARYRNRSSVKKIMESAAREGFTDVLIVNESRKEPDGLLVIHLPNGPTAHFRVSNVRITTELKKNYKQITQHRPEVVLKNFQTRLGYTVSRMLGALFHYSPEFEGRRAVAFHNQRDYIFFRHYKYLFDGDGKKARLRELGPRFTLKLRSLQKGLFNSKSGTYEFNLDKDRHRLETSRRKFFL